MKNYTTNKTIFEKNFAGYYDKPDHSFPFGQLFDYNQVCSLDDSLILFECDYTKDTDYCPKCNTISSSVKEYKYVYPSIATLNEKLVIAKIKKRSFRCNNKECNCITFVQTIEQITKRKRISKDITKAIIRSLSEVSAYKLIANRFGVSITQVLRIIDKISIKRISKSKVKNIKVDETRLLNKYSKKHGTFQFFVYDSDTNELLEILEDRSYINVLEYLNKFFSPGSLSTFTMDMWLPYKKAMNSVDENTHIIIDKFHYVRYIMNSLDNIRISIMNEIKNTYGISSPEYKELKSKVNLRTLRKKRSKITSMQHMELCSILSKYPTLYLAYNLKNDFLEATHNLSSSGSFKLFLNMYMQEVDKLNTNHFDDAKTVFANWETEIANSFDYDYTNAYVEGTNQKVKLIKRNGYGLSNLERTKKRMMIIFGKRGILESSIQNAI